MKKNNIYIEKVKREIEKEKERFELKEGEIIYEYKTILRKLTKKEMKYGGEKIRFKENKKKVEKIMNVINKINMKEIDEITNKRKFEMDDKIVERIQNLIYTTILVINKFTEGNNQLNYVKDKLECKLKYYEDKIKRLKDKKMNEKNEK